MADGESKGQDSPAAASPRPPRSQSAAAAALSTVVDVSSQLHAQLQSALTSLREGNSAAAASKPARALGFGPETALVDHLKRVDLFFRGQLEPYPRDEVKDTGAAKARRVLGSGLKLLKYYNPLAGTLEAMLPATDYGLAAFVFRKDLRELLSTMVQLLESVERESEVSLSAKRTAIALYYMAAYKRLERWADPDSEELEHQAGRSGVVEQVASDETVQAACRWLPFAQISYAASRAEAEFQALNNGYELVLSSPYTSPCQPAFCFMASRDQKTAILSIRGSNSIGDIFTDGKMHAVPLLGGLCHEGIHAAAEWILGGAGLVAVIGRFCQLGYNLVLTGHSLGGGVALVCGLLLSDSISQITVYTYGTPACLDETLANHEWVQANVHGVILRDDLVPRVSIANVVALAKEIQGREDMIATSYNEDMRAFYRRMKTLWAPARREKKLWDKRKMSGGQDPNCALPDSGTEAHPTAAVAATAGEEGVGVTDGDVASTDPTTEKDRARESGDPTAHDATGSQPRVTPAPAAVAVSVEETYPTTSGSAAAAAAVSVKPAVASAQPAVSRDWLSPAVFGQLPAWAKWRARQPTTPPVAPPFDPAKHPLDTEAQAAEAPVGDQCWSVRHSMTVDTVAEDAAQSLLRSGVAEATLELGGDAHEEDYVEVNREDVLTKLMVPGGRLLHIYQYRGLYRAALVDHRYRPLRRVELYGNTLSDHTMDSVADALRSVKAARRATQEPPRWMSMADEQARYCTVCFCEVTWATTSSSDAQHARTMRHCRSCGVIVCPECSTHTMTLPEIGIIVPSRVCDRCFWRP